MDYYLIETENKDIWDRDVLGIYVEGFVDKQLLIDFYYTNYGEMERSILEDSDLGNTKKFTVSDVKYQWCKLEKDEKGELYATLSDKEEVGSFGVTALYW